MKRYGPSQPLCWRFRLVQHIKVCSVFVVPFILADCLLRFCCSASLLPVWQFRVNWCILLFFRAFFTYFITWITKLLFPRFWSKHYPYSGHLFYLFLLLPLFWPPVLSVFVVTLILATYFICFCCYLYPDHLFNLFLLLPLSWPPV